MKNYAQVVKLDLKGSWNPQFFGDEQEKSLSCHHLVDLVTGQPTHPEVDQYLKPPLFAVETYNNFVRKDIQLNTTNPHFKGSLTLEL